MIQIQCIKCYTFMYGTIFDFEDHLFLNQIKVLFKYTNSVLE